MGLGRQTTDVDNLAAFLDWADSQGWRIWQNSAYGGVDNVHSKGSWHYDSEIASSLFNKKKYSLAADLNYGPSGAPAIERTKAKRAIRVAEAFGLGLIYARDGVVGSARNHKGHLHVDVGPTSNYGRGLVYTPRATSIKVYRIQKVLHAERDNQPGADTKKRAKALKAASRYGTVKFPHGVKFAQDVVGTSKDGEWGAKSRAAHDKTIKAIQGILGVKRDGVYGPVTDKALRSVIGRF